MRHKIHHDADWGFNYSNNEWKISKHGVKVLNVITSVGDANLVSILFNLMWSIVFTHREWFRELNDAQLSTFDWLFDEWSMQYKADDV